MKFYMTQQITHIFHFIILVSLISCKETDQTENYIQYWIGNEFIFPDISVPCYIQDEIVMPELDCSDFKIVCCIDSTGCTSCNLKLPYWENTLEYIHNNTSANIALILIVQQRNTNKITELLKSSDFNHYVYIDTVSDFIIQNKIPTQQNICCLLLDQHNRVAAIGNPIINGNIRTFFVKTINRLFNEDFKYRSDNDVNNAIKCNPKHLMLGLIRHGESKNATANIFNNTDSLIQIRQIDTSCDCVTAHIAHDSIPPKTSRRLSITLTNESMIGEFYRIVDIHFKNYDDPIEITIKAFGKE